MWLNHKSKRARNTRRKTRRRNPLTGIGPKPKKMKKISLEDGGAPARRGLVLYPARAFADLDETFGRAGDGEQNGTPWAPGACLCREKRASQVWLLSGCRTELQGRKVSTQRRCGFVEGASSAQKHLQQRISTHSGHKSHYAAAENGQKIEAKAAD